MFEGLFENLRFQRLLAQEPMKFANLVLQSPIIRSRHELFPAAGRGQAALRHQPTPGEQLVWGNAMPTSHQAYRHTRLEGLFDHANLLRGRPAPTTLNRRDDLNAQFGGYLTQAIMTPGFTTTKVWRARWNSIPSAYVVLT